METEPLGVTSEHPFYVKVHGARSNLEGGDNSDEGEWKAAHNLQTGDKVLQADGTWSTVESVSVRETGAKVYNFEVFDNHNYFVGEQGTLVHNTCGERPSIRKNEIASFEDFKARSVVGDQLEGHEILQHAILKREGLATNRLSSQASKGNPVIALERTPTHQAVNRAQAQLDLATQTPLQNIASNARILRELGIPRRTVQKLANKAVKHARTLGIDY